jgi:hypothetical protein
MVRLVSRSGARINDSGKRKRERRHAKAYEHP